MLSSLFRYVILFLLILSNGTLFALDHVIDWLPKGQNLRQRINLDSKWIEQEEKVDLWKVRQSLQIDQEELKILILRFSNADYFLLPNKQVRFVFQGTGLVYDLNQTSGELKRVDKTIHSGYNYTSIRFYRNNVLFSIGGEGFWSYNKHITFFDENNSKEWEILRPKNEGPQMMSDGFQGYSSTNDVFYSGGSNNKNYLEDEKITFVNEFQRFNFKDKTWEKLGTISSKIPLKEHRAIFWNGTHFVQMARDRIYIIDPAKNEVFTYKDNSTYFEAGGGRYISGDTIKYFHFPDRGHLKIIPVRDLLKKSTYVGEFYLVDYSSYYIVGIILVILIGLTWFIYKKKRSIEPTFEALEIKLLQALVRAGNESISTNDLNDILDYSSKSQESQRRIRFIMIKQVNEKIEFYFKISDAIERTTSTEDKRLINYRLKQGVQAKLSDILPRFE